MKNFSTLIPQPTYEIILRPIENHFAVLKDGENPGGSSVELGAQILEFKEMISKNSSESDFIQVLSTAAGD